MTKLNPVDLNPILFKSAEEFQTRERYKPQLTCAHDKLERIVGKYAFTEKEALECGLNGCGTKHWHGWVIRTTDGDETHCGRDCGEREFGVKFKEVEAAFKQAEERQSRTERLEQVARERDEILAVAIPMYERTSAAINHVQYILNQISKEANLKRVFDDCVRSRGRILVADEESR